ncbi:MAG TPA: universal stress protein [Acidimicrobiales bacterium]|nr:universal stress protein [Acidimicrobiales bacterium]
MAKDSPPVVVGVDGSPQSVAALQWAADYAAAVGAPVKVVISWQYPALYGSVPVVDEMNFEGAATKIVEKMAADIQIASPGLEVTTLVSAGRPAEILVRESENAALLVVGSQGHGAFAGMLIGSVSLHCVHHAHCPVVVVR